MKPFERLAAAAWAALAALAALDAARLLPLSRLSSLPLCAFHAITGLPCPGCGMTRALVAAFQGRWSDALRLNPLAPPLLALWTFWLACGALNRARGRAFSARWPDLFAGRRGWAALAAVLLLWAARLHAGSAADAVSVGCAMDGKTLKPMLAQGSDEIDSSVHRRKEQHALFEQAVLKDGVQVKVRQGGCAHYGKRFEFARVADATSLGQRRHYYELAASLLTRRAGADGGPIDLEFSRTLNDAIPNLREWLFEQTDSPRAWGDCTRSRCITSFRCEDAVCSVEVQREDDNRVTLAAAYDFPDVPH